MRIFRDTSSSLEDHISAVGLRVAKWVLIRKEFDNFQREGLYVML